jgi:hypothetical protein
MRQKPDGSLKKPDLDARLRLYVYGFFVDRGRAPLVAEMAKWLSSSVREAKAALERLSQTHAFVLQENGELWRAAPFSAVPTAFRAKIGRKSWYGNCIWDALGIPAMQRRHFEPRTSMGSGEGMVWQSPESARVPKTYARPELPSPPSGFIGDFRKLQG